MKRIASSLAPAIFLAGSLGAEKVRREPQIVRCPADICQEDYSERPFRNGIRQILHVIKIGLDELPAEVGSG